MMSFEPWMLAAMEEDGLMDTSEGCISRVAKVLNQSSNTVIDTAEFREACYRRDFLSDKSLYYIIL